MKAASFFVVLVMLLATLVQSKSIAPRIFNGQPASKGQFPWQVSMTLVREGKVYFCSGAIISTEWILTAAHCIVGVSSARVSAGSLLWSGVDLARETIVSSRIIPHEDYVSDTAWNDVGLVKLSRHLRFTEFIKPIELDDDEIGSGANVTIAGWGRLVENKTDLSDALRYVNLTTISNDECIPLIGSRFIPKTKICATSPRANIKSPCMGDSGGPLVLDAFSAKPVHIGVLSLLSDKGCESGLPSGYSRTSAFRDWIFENSGI